jgi:1,2-diacylglycerol 3-beta-galactosyltransferase
MPRNLDGLPRILVLFSDTGGGHRSAAEAVVEALEDAHPGQFEMDMVDVFVAYAPYPLNRMPKWYPRLVRWPRAWELGYKASDGHGRARAITASFWPWVRNAARQLVREHTADLVVNFHPLFNAPVLRALGKRRPPFITQVTDLVSTHALWYHRRADLCLVPTEEARQRGLRCGLVDERIRVLGLPVSRRFCTPLGDRAEQRRQLGWNSRGVTVLVVGGGEGMGPVFSTARAIAQSNRNCNLVVVAGRNAGFNAAEAVDWGIRRDLRLCDRMLRCVPQHLGDQGSPEQSAKRECRPADGDVQPAAGARRG